jgi:acetyl-CoA acetyltransferase
MRDVYIIGVGMTRFGLFFDRNMKSLAAEAITNAMTDAGISKSDIQTAFVANSLQGLYNGQESIRGQVVLRNMGIGMIPVFNIENACASSSSALNLAWLDVAAGMHDVALVVGMEKVALPNKADMLKMFTAGIDVETLEEFKAAAAKNMPSEDERRGKKEKTQGTVFMDFYASATRQYMEKYGLTQKQLAMVSSKNHNNSVHNPYAQFQKPMTFEEILAAKEVAYPLTVPMCSPLGDGASAVIIGDLDMVKKLGIRKPVKIAATVIQSGRDRTPDEQDIAEITANNAYKIAGVGPGDIDVAEVHDASAFGEIVAIESCGFCARGEGGVFTESGHTAISGKIPVNPSGGLESKGHPIAATGTAMIAELVWQLRGEAGKRQVEGARIGLAENGGGILGPDGAAMSVTILKSAF